MAAVLSASLWMILLPVGCFMVVSADQRNITAEPGGNVTLPCRADENKPVLAAEWIRTDLGSEDFVILYRDKQFDLEGQSEAFRNRVDLQDPKNGDVSLILKNVMIDDTGKYECRVKQKTETRTKRAVLDSDPISIVHLNVKSGIKDGRIKDGRKEDGGEKNGGNRIGLIVGLIVVAVVVAGCCCCCCCCTQSKAKMLVTQT